MMFVCMLKYVILAAAISWGDSQPQEGSVWPMFGHDARRSRFSSEAWNANASLGARALWTLHVSSDFTIGSTPVSATSMLYTFGCQSTATSILSGNSTVFENARPADARASCYPSPSSPAIGRGGSIYVGSPYSGFFVANGSLVPTIGDVASSPVIDSRGCAYFTTTKGSVYAVNNSGVNFTGVVRWAVHDIAGTAMVSSPALDPAGTRVYVTSALGNVFALECTTGELLWSVAVTLENVGASIVFRGSPAVSANGAVLYVVCSFNWLIAFDLVAANALSRGSYAVTPSSTSGRTVNSGGLFTTANKKTLSAVLWTYDLGYTTSATATTSDAVQFESSPVSNTAFTAASLPVTATTRR
jgi:outer membrane protein assembly factor BamB